MLKSYCSLCWFSHPLLLQTACLTSMETLIPPWRPKQAYDVVCHYCYITVSLAAFIAADMSLCWVNGKLLIQVATDQLDHK